MASRKAQVAPADDWQTVQSDDWQTVQPTAPPQPSGIDPSQLTPDTYSAAYKAAVHGKMLNMQPGDAYQNRDEVDKQLRSVGGDYDSPDLDPTIANDVKVGLAGSIFGIHANQKLPGQVQNAGKVDKLVQGITQMVADSPFMLAGGILGGIGGSEVPVAGNAVGAGAGAFALPAAVREALVLGIKNGTHQSASDLLRGAAQVMWAATKGAVTGAATEVAGGLPVGGLIAKSGLASVATKGLYQATALTTTADLLEGHAPTADDFVGNAALILPLNLITHGMAMPKGDLKQGQMDVFAKDGTTPEVQTGRLNAQPVAKPDLPPGLRPAIKMGEGHIEGDGAETHDQVAARVAAKNPVSMEKLEADPALADSVLEDPAIHDQAVIDRAYQLKKDAVDAGEVSPKPKTKESKPLYNMSPSEIDAAHKEASGRDQADEEDIFGKEGAKRYRALQRKANSSIDMQGADKASEQIQDMESGLTKEQQNKLYGIGDTRPQLEEISQYRDALGRIDASSPDSMAESLKWAVSQIDDPSRPVEQMNSKQQVRYAQLRHSFEIAKDNGWDTQDIIKKAVVSAADRFSEPADAMTMLEKVARSIGGSEQPALEGALEKPEKPLTIDDLYDKSSLKSGRGFTTPDGEFLSRDEAKSWMKENEPDVHDMWETVSGDAQAEMHTQHYVEARNRTQGMNMASGEPDYQTMGPDMTRFLGEARSGVLNRIKAGLESDRYGAEAIRTLLVGPKAKLRAEGAQIVDGLKKLVPDEVDQQALHFIRDYRDDPEALAKAVEEVRGGKNEKLKAYLPAMERALEPMSPEMTQADAAMTDYFQKALDMGKEVGTIKQGVDPSRYSPRMFMQATDEAAAPRSGGAQFSDRTVNSIRRKYLHTLDPLQEGGTEARTFNALDEMSIYNDHHAQSISVKLFKTELKNSKLGIEGTRDQVPKGWVEVDPSLRETKQIVNAEGESAYQSKNLYVPKEIADALSPLFRGGDVQIAKFLHIQSVIKGIELGLSAFHIKAMGITAMNNIGPLDTIDAWKADNEGRDFNTIEQRGGLYGLTTTKTGAPMESYKGLSDGTEPGKLAWLKDNKLMRGIDATFKGITYATFDVVQRKFKVMNFATKEAGWIARNPEGTEAEYGKAMRGYAKEINAAYGGLNWDIMGVSRSMQSISRLILLAPDWTFSNVANVKYALTDGGTAGNASRLFFAKSFATGMAMTAAVSLYVGGKYNPSDIKHMDQVYLGTDKNGKEMYSDWFFAGAPKDLMTLTKRVASDGVIAGMAEFIVSKAGPIAGMGIGLAENKSGSGKPIYKKTDSAGKQFVEQGEYATGRMLPLTGVSAVQTIVNALSDPDHVYSYKDLLNLAADAIGSPTYSYGSGNRESTVAPKGIKLPGLRKGTKGVQLPGQKKYSIRGGR